MAFRSYLLNTLVRVNWELSEEDHTYCSMVEYIYCILSATSGSI